MVGLGSSGSVAGGAGRDCAAGDARGSEVPPGGLLHDQLVQRQIRDRPPQTAIFNLEILQPLDLSGLQPAELSTPPIVADLADPDLADRIDNAVTLRHQHINLAQLRDDLFRLLALPWHIGPPRCQLHTSGRTTSMGEDQ